MLEVKQAYQDQAGSTSNTVHNENGAGGILALGILLLCAATCLLLFSVISAAAHKVSLYENEGLDIVMYPDTILREVAAPVESIGEEEVQLALLMENTMLRVSGGALSAPQVGVSKRMCVVRLSRSASDTEVIVMVNPHIIEQYGISTELERCLSLPRSLKIEVDRSERILVRFMTLDGEEVILEERGLNARVIQHTIEHLDGILIVDYAAEPEITPTTLLAIIVYSASAFVAIVICIRNRRRKGVQG